MLVTAPVSCWSAILKAIVFKSIQFNQLTVKVIPIPLFLNFRFRVDYVIDLFFMDRFDSGSALVSVGKSFSFVVDNGM
jgi:hypothetical protein